MAGRLLALLSFLAVLCSPGALAQSAPHWLRVDIGIIGVASDDILEDALQLAQEEKHNGILIVLDTPGGSLASTRTMVKKILGSPIPIVVWVGPRGAHAGSAGAFITLAAHVAAMAPGTVIGAAHPVSAEGKDIESEGDLREKVENDTAAFMESIAQLRKRNAKVAMDFVKSSLSITSDIALKDQVIDLIEDDPVSLLNKIEGRPVELENGKSHPIVSAGATITQFETSFRQDVLNILSHPQLFYLLFIAGLIGIAVELTHPGVLFPGVLGAISLLLALIASSVVSINFGAAVLILIAIGMMVAELFLPSFGILGIGGLVAFVIGSLFLIDTKSSFGLAIPLATVLPTALMLGGLFLSLAYLLFKNRKSRVQTGSEAMPGQVGVALEESVNGEGTMRVFGEIWAYQEADRKAVRAGESLEVQKQNGLTLIVKSISR